MNKQILLGSILIVIALIAGYLWYAGSSPQATVSAQGYASTTATPDLVSVQVSIETKNLTAQDAQESNSAIRERVIRELRYIGISDSDIEFSNYNIYPQYVWENGRNSQTGFIAHQDLIIKASEFSKVPEIVDSVIGEGGLVSYINFELSSKKQNEVKAFVLEEASRDAKTKAEALAKGQEKELGKLISLKPAELNYIPYRYYDASSASASGESASAAVQKAAAQIQPRSFDISSTVEVTYQLRR